MLAGGRKGIESRLGSIELFPDAEGRFEVVGLAPGPYRFFANTPALGLNVTLVKAGTGDPIVEVVIENQDSWVTLIAQDMVGEFTLVQRGVVIRAPFSVGRTVATMPQLAEQQAPVSLAKLSRDGVRRLVFRTESAGLFLCDVKELRHEPDGRVLVEVPQETPATIEIVPRDAAPPAKWRVLIRGQVPEFQGLAAEHRGDRWVFDCLRSGRYDLFWADYGRASRVPVPILAHMDVEQGRHYRVISDVPSISTASLVVDNWSGIPPNHHPRQIWVEDVPAHSTMVVGRFEIDVSAPLSRYKRVEFRCEWIGGVIVTDRITIVDDVMHVSFPDVATTMVSLHPEFGGEVTLSCYFERRAVTGPAVLLPAPVSAWPDGGFRVHCRAGDKVLCLVSERHPQTRHRVIRGLFRIVAEDRHVTPQIRGEWVSVECTGPGVTSVTGVTEFLGRDLLVPLASLPEGRSQLWLPGELSEIRVDSFLGSASYPRNTIQSTLRF